MEKILETTEIVTQDAPSSWRSKFEKKVKMTFEEQEAYRRSHWKELREKAIAVDEMLSKCDVLLADEDEIADVVSKYRREQYEATLRH